MITEIDSHSVKTGGLFFFQDGWLRKIRDVRVMALIRDGSRYLIVVCELQKIAEYGRTEIQHLLRCDIVPEEIVQLIIPGNKHFINRLYLVKCGSNGNRGIQYNQ